MEDTNIIEENDIVTVRANAIKEIAKLADIVWDRVFNVCDVAIKQAEKYSHAIHLLEGADPSLDDILKDLNELNTIASGLHLFFERHEDAEKVRLLLNCKQQILHIHSMASAVRLNNLEEFDEILVKLKAQARI